MRGMLLNGMDPKERDQEIRNLMMPTALFQQTANAVAQAMAPRTMAAVRTTAATQAIAARLIPVRPAAMTGPQVRDRISTMASASTHSTAPTAMATAAKAVSARR